MLKHKILINSGIQQQEAETITQLDHILNLESSQAKLVDNKGEEIFIPDSVYQIFRQVVHAMASGQPISLVPKNRLLTTQKAADILNISRAFLIKLLDAGEIPCIKVGKHPRVYFQDLMVYKQQRDNHRDKLLNQLIEMTEEAELYDK